MKTTGLVAAVLVLAAAIVTVRSRTSEHAVPRTAAARAVPSTLKTVTLKLPKMDCAGCEIGVRLAGSKIDGVKEVKTDSDKRIADVTFDPARTTAEASASGIKAGSGFDSELPPTK